MNDGRGASIWFTTSPLYDTRGVIVGAIESLRAITERKLAESELRAAYEQITATEEELRRQYRELAENEQKLRQSEARYRNVVEVQTELISRFLPDGTHVFVNEAYCRYFGKSREENWAYLHSGHTCGRPGNRETLFCIADPFTSRGQY
jgi:PAS domain-containing protein